MRLAKDRKALTVTFDTGESFALDAEYLRVMSPSAEVQGHSPDERKTLPGKRQVAILEVHPIGNYAVRLVFDDMHSTGIYSWDYFSELGRNHERRWQDYLDELASKGLSRDQIEQRRALFLLDLWRLVHFSQDLLGRLVARLLRRVQPILGSAGVLGSPTLWQEAAPD